MKAEIIGYLGALLGSISLIPEIKKALHTHHLKDVSSLMLYFLAAGSVFWIAYGIHINSYPNIISDSINLFASSALIWLKMHYEEHGHPLITTEKAPKEPKAALGSLEVGR